MTRPRKIVLSGVVLALAFPLGVNAALTHESVESLERARRELKESGAPSRVDELLLGPPAPEDDAAPAFLAAESLFVEPGRNADGSSFHDETKHRPTAAAIDSHVRANAACLERVDAGARRPRCSLGRQQIAALALDPVIWRSPGIFFWSLEQLMALRAVRQAETSSGDAGLAALDGMLTVSWRACAERPDFRACFERRSFDGKACECVASVLSCSEPSEASCRRLLARLGQPDTDLARAVQYQRLCALHVFDLVRAGRCDEWSPLVAREWWYGCSPEPFASAHPRAYQAFAALCPWTVTADEIGFLEVCARNEVIARRIGPGSESELERLDESTFAGPLTKTFWPQIHLADMLRYEARRALARVALALRVHRLRTGDYPDTLDALAPGILDAVPRDPFSGEPLHYARVGAGFLVYSVGRNLRDDGGKTTNGYDAKEPDDIALSVGR